MNGLSLALLAALLLTGVPAGVLGQEEATPPASDSRQVPQGSVTLKVTIRGIESDEGTIRVALFDSRETFETREHPLRAELLVIREGQSEWIVEDLVQGAYAIAVFHDRNENGELDTNLVGMPKEPYGFSNDARGRFGPPSFEEARFELGAESSTLEITVR